MVLDLQEEVVRAEDVLVLPGRIAGLAVVPTGQALAHFTLETGGEDDESLAVLAEQFLVDARLVVEALGVAGGDELDEVLVALVVRGQDDQMVVRPGVGLLVFDSGLVMARAVRDVHLAADDRLDLLLLHGVVELNGSEHVAVVRDGAGGHAELRHALGQLFGPGGTVQQGVFGV